jgi:LuxR family transcriptional regulator, maltose regulon positive regulatory protein
MQKSVSVIRTKLLIPKVRNDAIRRMKLTRKLKTISHFPLTLIHAGAGYGKSKALALFVSDENQKCCWYSVSVSDEDITTFLTYFIVSIRTVFPQLEVNLQKYVDSINDSISDEELSNLCTNFINEIISIEDEFFLIIDDYHKIEHSYSVNRWMEKFLEYLPPNLHLIISSRRKPDWKRLSFKRIQNQLLEITTDDFVLTMDEVEILLTDYYAKIVHEKEIHRIYQETEGWILAVGMMAQQIPDRIEFVDDQYGSSSKELQDLYRYLEIEVLEKQPPMIRRFLEQTSILENMEADLCNVLLKISNSSTILEQLTEQNLFIQKISVKEYRYHALFKGFLEQRLKLKDQQVYQHLHERSAQLFEKGRQWESAFYHYEKINRMKAIAYILKDHGFTMIKSGKLKNLYGYLKRISYRVKNHYYGLWFLEGEVLRLRSLYKEAETCYDVVLALAEKNKDDLEMGKALEGKAKIYLDTIQPYKAERLLYQAIEILENSGKKTEKELGELYQLLAENSINYGQMKKGEKWIQRARELNAPLLEGNLEARLYLRTGRFKKAKWILLASKRNQKDDNLQLPQSHRETDLLLSLIEVFMGNGSEAKSLAQNGIQLGIKLQSPYIEACGWMRMGHAVQLLSIYDSTLALECYETALTMMDEIKVDRGKAEPLMGICLLYGCSGEYEKSMEAGNMALQETEKVNDTWLASMITLSLGIVSISNRHFVEAEEFFRRAEKMFLECDDEYGRTLLLFWTSYLFFERQEKGPFRKNMTMFLKCVQMGSYEFLFHKRTLFGPRDLQQFAPLLIEANKKKISPYYVTKLLQDMNLSKLDSHPGYSLRIQTLGTFRVWLGEKEIEERDWQRGKAKELLQLLVTKFGRSLSKEDIFEMLWPEQDEKSCARDLKVSLNALNNALEPERKARSAPFFIYREGSSYGFNQHIRLELDALIFEEWIQGGLEEKNQEKAIQFLLKGLTLYKGEYLPERKYDDWCLNTREKLLVLFLRGAEKLAQLSVSAQDYNQAIYWCEQIIDKDYTWEEAYRLLMFCYYKKNNRSYSIKWYKKCCDILESEIGVQPLEATQQMYKMIMDSG